MTDLSHWDFAKQFSGYEAAALILGLEPRESAEDEHRVRVVAERMELDYSLALHSARWEGNPFFEDLPTKQSKDAASKHLVSVELDRLWSDYYEGVETPLSDWLDNKRASAFNNQEFSRESIAGWLKRIDQKSLYRFDKDSAVGPLAASTSVDTKSLLGAKERNTLLVIIAALCKEAKIDYSKPSKAAGLIRDTALRMGVNVGESTIEAHLKRIPDAVEARAT